MAPVSIDALRISANGQVFALERPLSRAAVEQAFRLATATATGRSFGRTIRQERTTDGLTFWSSFVCFRIVGPPAFLPETDLEEQFYGFLLLVELQVNAEWFLGVFKQRAGSITDWLESRAKLLPRGQLTNAFSENTTVRKMNLQRLAPTPYEIRAASFEGLDLQSSMPMMSAGRCSVRSVRFRDQARNNIAVTVGTSRVNRSGGRSETEDLARLVETVARETRADRRHPFLATFAQAVPLSDLPPGAAPNSVLFDWTELLENETLELYRKPPRGEAPVDGVPKRLPQRVLGDVLTVSDAGQGLWEFGRPGVAPRGTFDRNATKYSVKTILRNELIVRDVVTNETMPLTKWARDNDAFNITFTDPRYFYGGGALYLKGTLANEVDVIRRCLRAAAQLDNVISEKGRPGQQDTSFPQNSVFGQVETAIYANRSWLCCTDLGDEWADYFCIQNGSLLFIHCKAGTQTTGASDYQEVVAQALKNLGRIRTTPTEFDRKLTAIRLRQYWSNTQIELLREPGQPWNQFEQAVTEIATNADSPKEVHLVVTMLSRAQFEAAAANANPTAYFMQLVWLLGSFVNSCREMGAKPVIVCKT